ncbi:hypothetical protein M413DRAFT_297001 [Hebeloma cylindrosporum]|uniref:Single-stranded DNA-binding protein n=1 Tax=Hebeloma cylindrosporum TaxID=76867 RepID=A0A0C3CAQ6_HEBCY|nr:hypothetical protein M413DRAFT_297001 [Hebeloma cylindrosporum h7]
MFSILRVNAASFSASSRAFSTSPRRASDLAKLVLIGHLVKDPESRLTRHDKEYFTYTVATRNAPLPPDANGERRSSPSTFHRILSFHEGSNKYLRTLKKGSKVYVETAFEIREAEPEADPSTPQGQRQIFLRHESIKVLNYPKHDTPEEVSEASQSF